MQMLNCIKQSLNAARAVPETSHGKTPGNSADREPVESRKAKSVAKCDYSNFKPLNAFVTEDLARAATIEPIATPSIDSSRPAPNCGERSIDKGPDTQPFSLGGEMLQKRLKP
jgi:hypothetical protein